MTRFRQMSKPTESRTGDSQKGHVRATNHCRAQDANQRHWPYQMVHCPPASDVATPISEYFQQIKVVPVFSGLPVLDAPDIDASQLNR